MAHIKQGDAYYLPVRLTFEGGALPLATVERIEFMLDGGRQCWPGEVICDETAGEFLLPLTQAQSFRMPAGDYVSLDVRVKFQSGDVIGASVRQIIISEAVSKEVL